LYCESTFVITDPANCQQVVVSEKGTVVKIALTFSVPLAPAYIELR